MESLKIVAQGEVPEQLHSHAHHLGQVRPIESPRLYSQVCIKDKDKDTDKYKQDKNKNKENHGEVLTIKSPMFYSQVCNIIINVKCMRFSKKLFFPKNQRLKF